MSKEIKDIQFLEKPTNKFITREFLRKYNVFLTLVLMVILATSVTKGLFLSGGNLLNVGERASIIGIVALGQMMVILAGGFDLSIGGMIAIGFVIMGKTLDAGMSVPLTIILVLIACTAAGSAKDPSL